MNVRKYRAASAALSSYRQGWFSMDELKFTFRELVMAAHRATGEYEILS
jgi:hypothetical protein